MTYVPALPDWAHQTKARSAARRKPYFAYLMEMGTGKTKTAIDEMLELYEDGLIDVAVVMAPKGVYKNWVRTELPTHVPDRLEQEVFVGVWEPGGGRVANKEALQQLLSPLPGLRLLVINTESMSSGDRAYRYLLSFLESRKTGCYWVLDESTFIKNPEASRTKSVIQLSQMADYRRIMSGLPVPRGPLDMWSQAEFLRPGLLGNSYYAFRARYAVLKNQSLGSRTVKVVVGYQNIEELKSRIEPWSFRVTKEECLDLPAKVYTTREVELTDEQVRLYAEMRDFALAELANGEGTVSSQSVIVRMLRLQQMLCGHVQNDDGDVRDVQSNRLDTLMEVCGEVDGKVIIWTRFQRDRAAIAAALAEEYGWQAVAQFHGENVDSRQGESERFQNVPQCRFMVATYAGGHGNTWTAATTVVYYSNDFDLEKRAQSEDRAHRGGQTKRVTYVDLVAKNTVDEKILRALRDKINVASAVTGDNYREWIV